MEQIDRMSLISELFWITLFFLFFYFVVIGKLLPIIYTSLKLKQYLNFFYINKSKVLTKSFFIINSININLVKSLFLNWIICLNIHKRIKSNKINEI